jgi:hypothetical protein
MRQIAPIELAHVLRFELGRLGRSTLLTMQVQDPDRRSRGADMAAYHFMQRITRWEVYLDEPGGVRFLPDPERSAAIRSVMATLSKATINSLRAGSGPPYQQAREYVVYKLEERLADWHILVQEPGTNNGRAYTRFPWDRSDVA